MAWQMARRCHRAHEGCRAGTFEWPGCASKNSSSACSTKSVRARLASWSLGGGGAMGGAGAAGGRACMGGMGGAPAQALLKSPRLRSCMLPDHNLATAWSGTGEFRKD